MLFFQSYVEPFETDSAHILGKQKGTNTDPLVGKITA